MYLSKFWWWGLFLPDEVALSCWPICYTDDRGIWGGCCDVYIILHYSRIPPPAFRSYSGTQHTTGGFQKHSNLFWISSSHFSTFSGRFLSSRNKIRSTVETYESRQNDVRPHIKLIEYAIPPASSQKSRPLLLIQYTLHLATRVWTPDKPFVFLIIWLQHFSSFYFLLKPWLG